MRRRTDLLRQLYASHPSGGQRGEPLTAKKKTPHAPARARLPLLRFRPGGVGLDGATWGADDKSTGCTCHGAPLRTGRMLSGVVPKGTAHARRIRLVAYGARLESVLGASPRGFESPILRRISLPPRESRRMVTI